MKEGATGRIKFIKWNTAFLFKERLLGWYVLREGVGFSLKERKDSLGHKKILSCMVIADFTEAFIAMAGDCHVL